MLIGDNEQGRKYAITESILFPEGKRRNLKTVWIIHHPPSGQAICKNASPKAEVMINELDVVVLTEDLPASHFVKGDVRTVVPGPAHMRGGVCRPVR